MLDRLKAVWQQNGRVFTNFFSLSVLQFANYLAPLITLPYLFRVLGPSRFGLIEFARAVSLSFLILTDYGFNLSATREISVHRDDHAKVSQVFSSVMVLKGLLTVGSFLTLALLVLAFAKLRSDWPVYFLAFGAVVGQCLFPLWLFQGLERMKCIAVISVAAKSLVVASLFVFIKDAGDYLYVPLLQSAGSILMGLAGLVIAFRHLSVRPGLPCLSVLGRELANGWHIFISKMAASLYTTGNVVILGLFADTAYVAYFAAGDKIVRAIQGLQIPLSQAIFPHVGRLATESRHAALAFVSHVARIVGVVTLVLSTVLFAAAPTIAAVLLGPQSAASVPVIRILSFLPFIIGLSNIFGVQVMINFGLKKMLTRIMMAAGLLDIVLAVVLAVAYQHVGVSIAVLLTEIFVTVATFVALRKNGLHLFGDV